MILTFLLVRANPLIRLRCCRDFEVRERLGSNRARRRFALDTRMKNADWLDVIARVTLTVIGAAATWNKSCEISVRGSVYTLRRLENDRCRFSRLSKIAHMPRLRTPQCLRIVKVSS
jgi:hypothetical protein